MINQLKGKQVKVVYVSQLRIVLELANKQRIIVTPEINNHSYDDAIAFLEFDGADVELSDE